MTVNKRQRAEQKGRWAEFWVSLILCGLFFRRIAHRHRNPFGEIDLIFYRGDLLLFIEVKYRHGLGRQQLAFNAVEMLMPSSHQQKRLIKAADYFWQHHPEHHHRHLRFDLVVVHPTGWIWWFKNIFL